MKGRVVMREINIYTMFKVFKKRFLLLVIAAFLVTTLSGLYYLSTSKPVYSSSVTFLLERQPVIVEIEGKQEITYPNTQKELIDTAIGIIATNNISDRIIENAGYTQEIPTSDLLIMTTVLQRPDTALFTLTVYNTDLTVAYNLAAGAEKIVPSELTNRLQARVYSIDQPKKDIEKKPEIPVVTILVLDAITVATLYALLLILELLSSTIYGADELKSSFSHPVIGQIPQWKNINSKTNKLENDTVKTQELLNEKTPFVIAEGFNNVRTNLLHSSNSEKCPVYVVTSEKTDAGKSFIISNLALSYAKIGKKTLLIDADMRYPRQSKIFGIKTDKGLSNLLTDNCENGICYSGYISKTQYNNLDLLTSGQVVQNPSDLLSSKETEKLIEYAKENYDVIFIDLPPIGPVFDALTISNLVTGYLLVVPSGETNAKSIEQSLETLKFTNANIVGFILNNVKTKALKKSYKNSY